MSSNNQNNSAAWAKRVSEYDVITDDGPSSVDESWERLQRKYKNNPTKRKVLFYWAAAAVIAVISIPLLWNMRSDFGKVQTVPIVVKPVIKVKSPVVISKPDTQQFIVKENQTRKNLPLKKNNSKPAITRNRFTIQHENDTTALVSNNDSLKANKSLSILNTKPDTFTARRSPSIVHLNKIDPNLPQTEVDETKLQRFIRRYEVDVPNKTDAIGSTNNGIIIKNIN